MKRTTEAQIGGKIYSFEEDAYKHVLDYLRTAERKLRNDEDKDEIIADLEQAISARLKARKNSTEAVTLVEVIEIIDGMGTIETFEDEPKDKPAASWKTLLKSFPKRDSQSAILGGVCSGIARSKGGDASYTLLIRLVFVLFAMVSFGYFIFVYLLLWLLMPKDPLSSSDSSALSIVDQARLKRGEATTGVEKFARSTEKALRFIVKAVMVATRVVIGSVSSLLLAATVFGGVAGLYWLANSGTTEALRTAPVYTHVIAIMIALSVPLVALIAMSVKYKVKSSVHLLQVLTIVVPWLVAVIASFALIGVNQTAYANYIRKVKPNNAFVSTVTVGETVVIRCVSIASCESFPEFYVTNRCNTSFLSVTEEGKEFILYDTSGAWHRRIMDVVPPVTEEKFCEAVKKVQAQFNGNAVIADTPFDRPILVRNSDSDNYSLGWEFTYFVKTNEL